MDYLVYSRQSHARSGVHAPRSTVAACTGRAGAGWMLLSEARRAFVPGAAAVHCMLRNAGKQVALRPRQDQMRLYLTYA